MLNTKSFLAIDFGAGSLKLAEFEQNEAGGLRLKQYGIKPLGLEGSQEAGREAAMLKALQELLGEKNFSSRQSNVCAPGFHVFSKFVKLPPVDTSKVTQIIRYEAQQNVPFPLDEVVWDYQILGTSANNELEVLLVAVKSEIIEGLFRVGEAAGLRLKLVDVSSAALCNAFRYNYGEVEGCSMLLDIGAKTSNLLFFEKGKVYARSITIGANSITQDFGHEAKMRFPEAEATKIEKGSVSLGGAYEEPEDPQAAAIAKIARQVMTRLHIQVNQTIQFYRGQQGGSAPERLYLSGGASIMPYTAQFFAEKLNLPVDYFNPFRNIEIGPALDLEELSKYAHSFGEVVGLGLRDLAHCPVELNLMPESTLRWQSFNQKKPYFIATVFSLVMVVAAMGFLFEKLAGVKTDVLNKVKEDVGPEEVKEVKFKKTFGDLKKTQEEVNQIVGWMRDRYYWADVLSELRRVLIRVEQTTKTRLRTDAGIWVDRMVTAAPGPEGEAAPGLQPAPAPGGMMDPRFRARYGLDGRRGGPPPPGAEPAPPPPADSAAPDGSTSRKKPKSGDTNEIATVTLTFRAVSLKDVSGQADADKRIAYDVLGELLSSPLFDPDPQETRTDSEVTYEENGTFTFRIIARLKRPLKL